MLLLIQLSVTLHNWTRLLKAASPTALNQYQLTNNK